MTGRSSIWVARQHGHSISTMLRFYAAWADGAPESDVERIRAALRSERPLRRAAATGANWLPPRLIARLFEMEMPPARDIAPTRFATGLATSLSGSTAQSLKEP